MKNIFCLLIGTLGSGISAFMGGWDSGLTTLVIIMGVDYVMGLMLGGVFHNSPKSKNGRLESRAGFKGICKKFAMILVVVVCYRLDLLTGLSYLRDGVCVAFCVNEVISITENLGLMGISVPILNKAIDILQDKENVEKENKINE